MKKIFTKKRIIWALIILAAGGFIYFRVRSGQDSSGNTVTDTVKLQNLKQTVLTTGQVVSTTDLQLSFRATGIIAKVNVKEGDKVAAGQVLANLDQKDQLASLTQAQGALAQAQASYERVLAGSSDEDVAVAQRAVDAAQVSLDNAKQTLENTKQQQQISVDNAYKSLLNSSLAAVPQTGNVSAVSLTVSGAYTGQDQGQYLISIYNTGLGQRFAYSGLETGNGEVKTQPVPLGTRGLFVQFSDTNPSTADRWLINIPNTQAANYVTNFNAYQTAQQTQKSSVDAAQAAVNSAQVALAQSQANLNLKRAQARPADLAAARAQILTAQGQVQAAQAILENTIIRAPAAGTITSVDGKTGEQAGPTRPLLVLQDVDSLHIEADVSEANIASIQPGQQVEVTFDALGPDRIFSATVQTINPASTVVSGVVNYKVKASMDNIAEIKPGMTANMSILVAEKNGVLAVPSRAVVSVDGVKSVRVVTDAKTKAYREQEVRLGLEADGGLSEILSGLEEGQEIVTFIKQ